MDNKSKGSSPHNKVANPGLKSPALLATRDVAGKTFTEPLSIEGK